MQNIMRNLIDSHCHIQQLPRSAILEAIQGGISTFICNSTSQEDWNEVLSLKSAEIIPCIGIHPWYLPTAQADWETSMRDLIRLEGVHVGEIGLDNYKAKTIPKKTQEVFFRKQLQMALEFNKVANIHCVSAFGKLEKVLREEKNHQKLKILLHSWEGPWETTRAIIETFGQDVVFSLSMVSVSKEKHREVVMRIPAENVVIETDSPSQCVESLLREQPEICEGKAVNKPIYLKYVLDALADIRGVDPTHLSVQMSQNFARIFLS